MWWSPKLEETFIDCLKKVAEGSKFVRLPSLFMHGCIVKFDELTKEGESLSFKGSREYWIWSCMIEHYVNTNQIRWREHQACTALQRKPWSLQHWCLCIVSFYLSLKAWLLSSHVTFIITLFVSSTILMRSPSVITWLQIELTVSQFFLANGVGPCPVGKSCCSSSCVSRIWCADKCFSCSQFHVLTLVIWPSECFLWLFWYCIVIVLITDLISTLELLLFWDFINQHWILSDVIVSIIIYDFICLFLIFFIWLYVGSSSIIVIILVLETDSAWLELAFIDFLWSC